MGSGDEALTALVLEQGAAPPGQLGALRVPSSVRQVHELLPQSATTDAFPVRTQRRKPPCISSAFGAVR